MQNLDLTKNAIGNLGAQYLADGLRENKVIIISFLILSFQIEFQGLVKLILRNNLIGDTGIEYLATALQMNKVIIFFRFVVRHY